MTRIRPEIHAFAIAMLLILGACASTPPPSGLLNEAESAIRTARDARADDFAPVELGFAEEALAAAQLAVQERDYEAARLHAIQAELDARLAIARSRAALGREGVKRGSEQNQRLRRELLGEGAGA
jgi:hypothetical protein